MILMMKQAMTRTAISNDNNANNSNNNSNY